VDTSESSGIGIRGPWSGIRVGEQFARFSAPRIPDPASRILAIAQSDTSRFCKSASHRGNWEPSTQATD
jgi:hypothetical protein